MRVETSRGDVVLLSSLAMHFGRARAPAANARAWNFALQSTCVPADGCARRTVGASKRDALGPDPDPHTVLHRANTTTHPPEGLRFKPQFGYGRSLPPHGVAEGITAPPQWLLRDETTPRLAGAQPHARTG